jgi:hypothetical protein
MPRVKLTPELKKAISLLPDKEKDKLLFRLISLKPDLAEQLNFKLLEGGETTLERREDVKSYIDRYLQSQVPIYYSPGYLLMEIRYLSGRINDHVKTTRDKYGEVELNLFLLNKTFELFGPKVVKATRRRAESFNKYVVKRAQKILKLIDKLHEDLRLDFWENMNELAENIEKQPTTLATAAELELNMDDLKK